MRLRGLLRAMLALSLLLVAGPSWAGAPIRAGYQSFCNPWKAAIASGAFEAATGREIRFIRFESDAEVMKAMAAGKIDVGEAGSGAIAAGLGRGVGVELFWIVDDVAMAEAFVARRGTFIDPAKPETLKGKRIGVTRDSTSHFQTLAALDLWKVAPGDVRLVDLQPQGMAAAWDKGEIDAAFVRDPVLGHLKRDGKVMLTSGDLAQEGRPSFDGMVGRTAFVAANPSFMIRFAETMAKADTAYHDGKNAWTAASEPVARIVGLTGGEAEGVPIALGLYHFPTLDEQVSQRWLGGGAADILRKTALFLRRNGAVERVLDDYAPYVTPRYARAAVRPLADG
ncbi:MAG: ABC transporter substrate-binding protein [Geminicoccaceae bacterium]|nr:ABC transporter substrate-binding protein [Geminicoccaceae bacterium]